MENLLDGVFSPVWWMSVFALSVIINLASSVILPIIKKLSATLTTNMQLADDKIYAWMAKDQSNLHTVMQLRTFFMMRYYSTIILTLAFFALAILSSFLISFMLYVIAVTLLIYSNMFSRKARKYNLLLDQYQKNHDILKSI